MNAIWTGGSGRNSARPNAPIATPTQASAINATASTQLGREAQKACRSRVETMENTAKNSKVRKVDDELPCHEKGDHDEPALPRARPAARRR